MKNINKSHISIRILRGLLILVFISSYISCSDKTNNNNSGSNVVNSTTTSSGGTSGASGSNGSSDNSSIPNDTGTNPGCYDPGIGTQALDYYNHSIVAHGKGALGVNWSSLDDPSLQSEGLQNMFRTDSRFKVRVLVLASPGGSDNYNNSCFGPVPYKKLQVEVGIKTPGGYGYVDTHVFDDISVDGCSEVASFNVPSISDPLIVEVRDVKWDYTCDTYYGCSDPSKDCSTIPQCPWDYVWSPDCFEIVLQWSTDNTKDFP